MCQPQPLPVRLVLAAAVMVAGLAGTPARAQQDSDRTLGPAPEALRGRGDAPQEPMVLTPVVWSVLATPVVPVKGSDGRRHLAYELLFTNVTNGAVRLNSIEVLDQRNQVVGANRVVTVKDEEVAARFRPYTLEQFTFDRTNYSRELGPGQSALVYFDVTLNDLRPIPRRLKHRVTVTQPSRLDADNFPLVTTAVSGLTPVTEAEAVVLSPPLKGDRWVDGDGCCAVIGAHRFTANPINGVQRPAERFAIDFVQLDAQGRIFSGDPKSLQNWHYYGAEVVAAAPGRVVAVTNDLRDEEPLTHPAVVTAETAAGNHVIVDIGDGRFVMYAHLIPGSVPVSEGDFVARGQRLGLLGNSGNSDAPHLHFQVMDGPSPLDANGLPFVFDHMEFQGRLVGNADDVGNSLLKGEAQQINPAGSGARRGEMPLTLDVIGFGDKAAGKLWGEPDAPPRLDQLSFWRVR